MFVTGVPAEVTIDVGLGVRSVPAPGQQPQVFETVEPTTARPAWNAMQPWMSEVARPGRGATSTYLRGVNTNLRPGDALLFVGGEFLNNRSANEWDFRILDRVEADAANDRTRVSWSRPLGSLSPPKGPAALPRTFALRQRASVYGHHAPAWASVPIIPRRLRNGLSDARQRSAGLARVRRRRGLAALRDLARGELGRSRRRVLGDHRRQFRGARQGRLQLPGRAGASGHLRRALPRHGGDGSVARGLRAVGEGDPPRPRRRELRDVLDAIRAARACSRSRRSWSLRQYPVTDAVSGTDIPVNVSADGLLPGRRLLVRGTRAPTAPPSCMRRRSSPRIRSAPPGRVLEIDPPLPEPLDRASVVVHANVAPASHGESVAQILGAGNAATPFQRFELKQLPLTFRAAATELGAASELTVRVDDIAWKVRDTLFGAGPRDRVFTLIERRAGTHVRPVRRRRARRAAAERRQQRPRPLPQGSRSRRATWRPRA